MKDNSLNVAISQIFQGLAVKSAVESLRRGRSDYRGIVFSNLFDPVSSFSDSTLDRHGHWKCLHYFARRFFSGF